MNVLGIGTKRPIRVLSATLAAAIFLVAPADAEADGANAQTIVYEASFFDQYHPVTALDMVERVPGFALDEGEELRGFGATAGNILIDGARPSTKSDSLEDVLDRIPANRVERIELIRGATGALDAQRQSIIVNVVLKKSDDAKSAVAWEAAADYDGGRVRPRGEISYSGKVRATGITLGVERLDIFFREKGVELFTAVAEDDQTRSERLEGAFKMTSGIVKTATQRKNGDTLRANVQITDQKFSFTEESLRTPLSGGPADLFTQDFLEDSVSIEASGDYEHAFTPSFALKAIALVNLEKTDEVFALTIASADNTMSESRFRSMSKKSESIGRLEFDWTRWPAHSLQFGGEGVYNFIDSESTFTIDNGAGPEEIPLDGADTRVSETRGEIFLVDSWSANDKWTVDAGFAFEISKISQSGDFVNDRMFYYAKPSVAVTYAPLEKTQLRLRFEREVAQLDFFEFVSAANLDDEDVDFGNPELQPERTWALEGVFERRFGPVGVVSATVFYDWIDDVQDFLPLGRTFEIPGNIGDARRWGAGLNATAPLGALGLGNARLEASGEIQDSSVTDPVTGAKRVLSSERAWRYSVDFRQDFSAAKVSWGWSASDSASLSAFGLDETVTDDEGVNLGAFVETTRAPGAKIRLDIGNILNRRETRNRTVFENSRELSDAAFEEARSRNLGRSVVVTVSGTF